MKIKLKVKYNTLEALCHLYDFMHVFEQEYPNSIQFTKEYKARKNIIDLQFIKLKKKRIEKQLEDKPFNLNFEYHQAYYLFEFINTNVEKLEVHLDQTLIRMFAMKLHQQL